MYKTVRHGENSLQYTILPQNDDFRIEGKLSSAGSNCASTPGRKGKARRQRRRSFFAYLGLIFICTVIVGAVLIPFLVSAECLPNPTEWFLKTKAALTHGGSINGPHRNGGGPRRVLENGAGAQHQTLHSSAVAVASVGQKVEIINSDGVEKIILRVNRTQTQQKLNETKARPVGYTSEQEQQPPAEEAPLRPVTDEPATLTPTLNSGTQFTQGKVATPQPAMSEVNNLVTEVRFESVDKVASLQAGAPTIVVTTTQRTPLYTQNDNQMISNGNAELATNSSELQIPARIAQVSATAVIRPTTSFSTTSIYSPHAPAAASNSAAAPAAANVNAISNQNLSVPAMPTITTRIMQLPLLKSAVKKPIMPPVLVRTNSEAASAKQANNNVAIDGVGDGVFANTGAESSAHDDTLDTPTKVNMADVEEAKNADWIQSHWPYIDPSTYFQWTGYKEDSVLLPALLGFALTGMILIIAICLIARNKRAIVSSVRKRKRNDVEEAGADDNTTLLTTANLSDED
ncbi:uncharacterized protein LOC101451271 [Ceratitis capitata]|uniref:uncharacterized protein LOC101451271 n=1 Tax=Ceratitis capitata TaxID=7213 RepID=UPI000329BC13|nr:uncharacterized protein LOC101451271 [Ceratitis capitata]